MRPALALLVLPALVSGAHAADVKGTSRIDAVTRLSIRRRADAHRQGQARGRRPCHSVRGPAGARHSRARSASRARPRAKLEIGSVDSRRMFVPRTDDAVAATERKRVEDAIEKLKDDRAILQAAVQAAEAQKTLIGNLAQLPTRPAPANGAAPAQPDWDADFRHHRPALRRGAEGGPRDAGQDARGRPADQRPRRQARLPGAGPGRAHRGQDLRQCRRPRSRPTSPSATRSAPRRGCPSTMRASPPAPRRRRPSCSSCAAPASSSAAARAGTTSRSRSPPPAPAPAPPRRSCSR